MIKVLDLPISRWTVSRAEHSLAASIHGRPRSFFDGRSGQLFQYTKQLYNMFVVGDLHCDRPMVPSDIVIGRGDGSNAYTLVSSKVFASELIAKVYSRPRSVEQLVSAVCHSCHVSSVCCSHCCSSLCVMSPLGGLVYSRNRRDA